MSCPGSQHDVTFFLFVPADRLCSLARQSVTSSCSFSCFTSCDGDCPSPDRCSGRQRVSGARIPAAQPHGARLVTTQVSPLFFAVFVFFKNAIEIQWPHEKPHAGKVHTPAEAGVCPRVCGSLSSRCLHQLRQSLVSSVTCLPSTAVPRQRQPASCPAGYFSCSRTLPTWTRSGCPFFS